MSHNVTLMLCIQGLPNYEYVLYKGQKNDFAQFAINTIISKEARQH